MFLTRTITFFVFPRCNCISCSSSCLCRGKMKVGLTNSKLSLPKSSEYISNLLAKLTLCKLYLIPQKKLALDRTFDLLTFSFSTISLILGIVYRVVQYASQCQRNRESSRIDMTPGASLTDPSGVPLIVIRSSDLR